MKEKLLNICENTCWCEFCDKKIGKGERFLFVWKNAWKGFTRTNICQFCLLKIFIELAPDKEAISKIKKEMILENLN